MYSDIIGGLYLFIHSCISLYIHFCIIIYSFIIDLLIYDLYILFITWNQFTISINHSIINM